MRMRLLRFVLLALVLPAAMLRAELRTFTLAHADPEALLPSVQALLRPGETASAYRDTLVVDAAGPSFERIEQLLREVDRAPRNLLISLRRHDGDRRITTQHGPQGPHTVTTGSVSIVSTGSRAREQSVRALEGNPVAIRDGQLVALALGDGDWTRIDYAESSEGFVVSARVDGAQVWLDLQAHSDRMDDGTLRTGAIESSVSGPVGEWIWLGSATTESAAQAEGIAATASTRSRAGEQYEIRVEIVP